jgi:NADPH-dependent ferric siderophore reductase
VSKTHPARLRVIRTEPVAPSMVRVVLGGDGFTDFLGRHDALAERYTDTYVKLVFLADGFVYPEPLDLDVVKATMPAEAWPVLRTYTVRWVDAVAGEIAIDFVVHGSDPHDGMPRIPPRTGTCSSVTKQVCPPSRPRSRPCPRVRGQLPSSRSAGRPTRSSS